ncbi:MAG: fibronectin type III domain-containing protein, partial [Planctomycetota bacterium]
TMPRTFHLLGCRLLAIIFNRLTVGLMLSSCALSQVNAHEDHPVAPAAAKKKPVAVDERVVHRPGKMPDRIVLTWTADPATSQAVTWRTDTTVEEPVAQLAVAEASSSFEKKAKPFPATTAHLETDIHACLCHTVEFADLQPNTKYVYRVGDGVNWSEWFHFRTANDKPEPFSFIYFGDAQNSLRSHWSRVIREAYSDAPKARFFIHAGDLVNNSKRDVEWGEWFQAGGWLNAMIPSVPVPGNHEYLSEKIADTDKTVRYLNRHWRPQFALPTNGPPGLEETTYRLDYQGVRFLLLNSNEPPEKQVSWIDEQLAAPGASWKILAFHHPIYSAAIKRDNAGLRKAWKPVFDRHRVDLVLQGHDHAYARTRQVGAGNVENVPTGVNARSDEGGTVYVVSVSGPKMYGAAEQPLFRRQAEDTQLYQIIHLDGESLRYEARTAHGELYDAFTLHKRAGQHNELVEQVPNTPARLREKTPR